jgi:hypothetical protein
VQATTETVDSFSTQSKAAELPLIVIGLVENNFVFFNDTTILA